MKNTQKSTEWAVRVFMSWEEERNKRSDEKRPIEVLCNGASSWAVSLALRVREGGQAH